jgi:hypothetical protein
MFNNYRSYYNKEPEQSCMTDHRIKNNPLSSFENKQRSFSNISYMVFFAYFYNIWGHYKRFISSYHLINGSCQDSWHIAQALVSFKKNMPPPLPYFKVNICPLPIPHFASIFFAYLWSFRWPNYIVTLPRYFSFWLPHLNINTGGPSDELEGNFQRKSHFLFFSQWNGYSHFDIIGSAKGSQISETYWGEVGNG